MFTVILAGRVGKKPETRFTANGQKVTTFSMAVNQRKGKEEVTTWVRITIWGDRYDKMLSYVDKGSGLIVTGKMNPPSTYQDKEGRTQFSLEVTAELVEFSPFGRPDSPGSNGDQAGHQGGAQYSQQQSSGYSNGGGYESGAYSQPAYSQQAPYQGQNASHSGFRHGQGDTASSEFDDDNLPF